MSHKLEYLWLDGCTPTQIRYKTKVVKEPLKVPEWGFDPIWGFDGSSTEQADGGSSDCQLKPVRVYPNPLEEDSSIVLCEVYNVDDTPHKSNTRRLLEETIPGGIDEWVGFEQEYTLFKDAIPLGWPEVGEPNPQGDYYCGRNIGENISREHLNACIKAGISICGTNAEVMLGQWEYQIGAGGSIHMSDDLWVARWLMERICEKHGLSVSLHPKPVSGDWNGAGCHTNFSTKHMREDGGYDKIIEACEKLSKNPQEHIDVYGQDNDKRLTGEHETCSIEEFRYGVSDRGASIRIPWQVERDGKGYLEDRRPSSNCDPYVVSQKLMETICK
ncbi:glutamine synthetase [Candidatus Woesearchaeota archaeon]|jgi:glutamine synthetase|nr:glutamine synthetase [Candidatus Woesearchaeota archaeon]MBT6130486.1 glutamine synthetase [Candidatus Neomarinimicrobiota bacterium]